MRRREFLFGALGALTSLPSVAQTRIPVICFVTSAGAVSMQLFETSFVESMRKYGYSIGRDYKTEIRTADFNREALQSIAAHLEGERPDVVVANLGRTGVAVHNALPSVPVVVVAGVDFQSLGLINSYASPGLNATGIELIQPGQSGKQLDFAMALLKPGQRIGLIRQRDTVVTLSADLKATATAAGIELLEEYVSNPGELISGLVSLKTRGAAIVLIPGEPFFQAEAAHVGRTLLNLRLPAVAAYREVASAGALMSYGVNLASNYARGAYFVDKILKGIPASQIPAEFAQRLEMVVNMKSANLIGIAIPPALLSLADEVIE